MNKFVARIRQNITSPSGAYQNAVSRISEDWAGIHLPKTLYHYSQRRKKKCFHQSKVQMHSDYLNPKNLDSNSDQDTLLDSNRIVKLLYTVSKHRQRDKTTLKILEITLKCLRLDHFTLDATHISMLFSAIGNIMDSDKRELKYMTTLNLPISNKRKDLYANETTNPNLQIYKDTFTTPNKQIMSPYIWFIKEKYNQLARFQSPLFSENIQLFADILSLTCSKIDRFKDFEMSNLLRSLNKLYISDPVLLALILNQLETIYKDQFSPKLIINTFLSLSKLLTSMPLTNHARMKLHLFICFKINEFSVHKLTGQDIANIFISFHKLGFLLPVVLSQRLNSRLSNLLVNNKISNIHMSQILFYLNDVNGLSCFSKIPQKAILPYIPKNEACHFSPEDKNLFQASIDKTQIVENLVIFRYLLRHATDKMKDFERSELLSFLGAIGNGKVDYPPLTLSILKQLSIIFLDPKTHQIRNLPTIYDYSILLINLVKIMQWNFVNYLSDTCIFKRDDQYYGNLNIQPLKGASWPIHLVFINFVSLLSSQLKRLIDSNSMISTDKKALAYPLSNIHFSLLISSFYNINLIEKLLLLRFKDISTVEPPEISNIESRQWYISWTALLLANFNISITQKGTFYLKGFTSNTYFSRSSYLITRNLSQFSFEGLQVMNNTIDLILSTLNLYQSRYNKLKSESSMQKDVSETVSYILLNDFENSSTSLIKEAACGPYSADLLLLPNKP